MQAWGTQSRYSVRDTGLEPSKSGVLGILAAALGRGRMESIEDLAKLVMAVRVDKEGTVNVDYHTAQSVCRVKGTGPPKETELSNRYYLADASFLVALRGQQKLLEECNKALQAPHWPLFLGRKAFVPARPVWVPDGLSQDKDPIEVLVKYPIEKTAEEMVRFICDNKKGREVRKDIPLSFNDEDRRYAVRRVETTFREWETMTCISQN